MVNIHQKINIVKSAKSIQGKNISVTGYWFLVTIYWFLPFPILYLLFPISHFLFSIFLSLTKQFDDLPHTKNSALPLATRYFEINQRLLAIQLSVGYRICFSILLSFFPVLQDLSACGGLSSRGLNDRDYVPALIRRREFLIIPIFREPARRLLWRFQIRPAKYCSTGT